MGGGRATKITIIATVVATSIHVNRFQQIGNFAKIYQFFQETPRRAIKINIS